MTTDVPRIDPSPGVGVFGAGSFRVDRTGGVAEVVFARPDRRNALDASAVAELGGLLRSLDADSSVAAVLLYGEGSSFCAGADLAEFSGQLGRSAFEYHDGGQGWVDLMMLPPRMRVPVIAAPHGHALAGGCGIVAAADVVVAAAGTQFGVSEIKVGLFPIVVFPTLARAIGSRAARELALSGRRVEVVEAQRLGLVYHVAPPGEHLDLARQLACEMAGYGPDALRLGKFLMHAVEDLPLEQATAFAQSMRGTFLATPDFAEGVAAFLEKRPARFR